MEMRPHFIALLSFISEENGGRKTPALSGYRPTIKFPFESSQFSGAQNYIGTENAFPGETLKAEITLLSPEKLKNELYEGLEFDFFEGENIIGHGLITKIIKF